ncbi:MAG TPA: hypothetical protein VGM82_24775 [Gemmatimonadaceae bacterium]|jgi:hypothetical protein
MTAPDARVVLDARLRTAIDHATLNRDGSDISDTVRRLLAEACRVARAASIPPESVIVAVKQHWTAQYDARYDDRLTSRDTLDRLVTACVEVYFADGDSQPR